MTTASQSHSDVLIVGGGPAGAAAAILLAQQGRAVQIIEKFPAAHHKVCGEFLSHEALSYLERLGVDLPALGAASIQRLRLAASRLIAECDLPFPAMSLSRRTLDEALLQCAVNAGATVLRGCRVESLARAGSNWTARLSNGDLRSASNAFLATGKHDLGGHPRPPGRQNDLISFKMYYRLAPTQQAALKHHVELIVFPGGYAGLQLVEDGTANLCLLVSRKQLHACGGMWNGLIARILRSSQFLCERLHQATPQLEKPLALSSIPYGLLQQHASDGLFRLGDQAAVIPSFSGDGMSIALHSAHVAARIFLAGCNADSYQYRLARELSYSVSVATAVSRSVIASPGLVHLARLCPPVLRQIARGTRVPTYAMLESAHPVTGVTN
ncbi:MAG TPA: FAD-dependent monooxygenase [Acidobacteriaceae bacterium]|nr:FAD-dependent monooxygenase [Acidobacteriaceae bacterium]